MAKTNEQTIIQYGALTQSAEDLRELVSEFLGDGLSLNDLHLIRIPTAGGKTWELPSELGAATFSGILLGLQSVRNLWAGEYTGEVTAPKCFSRDGVTGEGDPGGACAPCPLNKWGTGKNGGKACSETKLLFILMGQDILPVILKLPSTSFANLQRYKVDLLNARLRPTDVTTVFSLMAAQNKGGNKYSKAAFSPGARLPVEEAARARAYADLLSQSLKTTAPLSDGVEMAGGADVPEPNDEDVPLNWK